MVNVMENQILANVTQDGKVSYVVNQFVVLDVI